MQSKGAIIGALKYVCVLKITPLKWVLRNRKLKKVRISRGLKNVAFQSLTCQGEGTGAPGWGWCLTASLRLRPTSEPAGLKLLQPGPCYKIIQTLCLQPSLLPRH